MNSFALLVLFTWPLLALVPFARLGASRASALVIVLGWLFLPNVSVNLPGLPNYTKWTAMALGLLAGTLVFHSDRLARFRVGLADVPVTLWVLSAVGASLTNGYGLYDGLSASFNRALTWGIPWLAGRIHFTTRRDREELLVVLAGAALAYTPLVLWEVRMSPQLHRAVYGFAQHSFAQTYRGGGWRPMVFTDHGLALSLFLGCSTVAALALHRVREGVAGLPTLAVFAVLAVATVLCKSLGALVLMLLGLVLFVLPVPVVGWVLLLVLPVAYMLVRLLSPMLLDGFLGVFDFVSKDRIDSLVYRWRCEDLLAGIGMQKPWFGVTTRGYATYDEYGQARQVVTDSLWIISFVGFGITGLLGSFGTVLLGAGRALLVRLEEASSVAARPRIAIGIMLLVVTFDCLANSFVTPLWVMMAGVAGSVGATGTELAMPTSAGAAIPIASVAEVRRLARRDSQEVEQTRATGGRLRRRALKRFNPRERLP